jgi:hypothetical protein
MNISALPRTRVEGDGNAAVEKLSFRRGGKRCRRR